ncbi:MAG: hypothetical protein ACLQUW_12680 [Desulfobaccales bacterium]
MLDWENTLETLRRQGWGYGFGRCPGGQTGEEVYLVNLSRGDKRLSIRKPSIEEAVTVISQLAQGET